jgi:nucleotide-binding universal stress UspA family protein
VTDLLERVVVPVASEDVAEQTAVMAREFLREDSVVHVLHVVQDEDAFADASEAEWAAFAQEAFDAFVEQYGSEVETEVRHGTDIAETIVETAEELGASGVLFVPRGGSRWRQLMSGDVARELVSESTVPVVALPSPDED